jgi:hypothetical protein
VLHNTAGENSLHPKCFSNLLKIRSLAFVSKSDAVGDDLKAGQPREAVIDTFCDSIGNVIGVGILAPHIEGQNGDGIDGPCFRFLNLQIDAEANREGGQHQNSCDG